MLTVDVDPALLLPQATTDQLVNELGRRARRGDDRARSLLPGAATRKGAIELDPGALVLVSSSTMSEPRDWWVAVVKWADQRDVCIRHERGSWSGEDGAITQVVHRAHIRAVGGYEALRRFQNQAKVLIAAEQRVVDEATSALEQARVALYGRLEQLGMAATASLQDERQGDS